jgi:hypothetical protein
VDEGFRCAARARNGIDLEELSAVSSQRFSQKELNVCWLIAESK